MRKMVSLLFSAIMTFTAIAPYSANAIYVEGFDEDSFLGYTKLEEPEWFGKTYDAVYMKYNKDFGSAAVCLVSSAQDTIWLDVPVDTDIDELVGIISNIDGELELSGGVLSNDYLVFGIKRNGQDKEAQRINAGTAKSLYSELKDIALHFDYCFDRIDCKYVSYVYLTGYDPYDYKSMKIDPSIEEKLSEYISDSEVMAELVKYTEGETDIYGKSVNKDMIYVVPKDEISPIQHYELAKNIAGSTSIFPIGISPQELADEIYEKRIDVANSVNGDANCDGQLTIADATSVLQALGNPEKYALSAQGEFNADVYGNGDGLTAMDALTIQRYSSHIIGSF